LLTTSNYKSSTIAQMVAQHQCCSCTSRIFAIKYGVQYLSITHSSFSVIS